MTKTELERRNRLPTKGMDNTFNKSLGDRLLKAMREIEDEANNAKDKTTVGD